MSKESSRRQFLQYGSAAAAGAAAGWLLPRDSVLVSRAWANEPAEEGPEDRLRRLGIELPAAPEPVATYVPAVAVGNLLFVAGHGPRKLDGGPVVGKVGREMSLEEGQQAARLAGLRILSTVRSAVGSLDRVLRLVKTLGMVNATPDFTQQPQVVNGFSDLIVEVFGADLGKGARSAAGVASLPGGIPVEIEAVFQLRRSTG